MCASILMEAELFETQALNNLGRRRRRGLAAGTVKVLVSGFQKFSSFLSDLEHTGSTGETLSPSGPLSPARPEHIGRCVAKSIVSKPTPQSKVKGKKRITKLGSQVLLPCGKLLCRSHRAGVKCCGSSCVVRCTRAQHDAEPGAPSPGGRASREARAQCVRVGGVRARRRQGGLVRGPWHEGTAVHGGGLQVVG